MVRQRSAPAAAQPDAGDPWLGLSQPAPQSQQQQHHMSPQQRPGGLGAAGPAPLSQFGGLVGTAGFPGGGGFSSPGAYAAAASDPFAAAYAAASSRALSQHGGGLPLSSAPGPSPAATAAAAMQVGTLRLHVAS